MKTFTFSRAADTDSALHTLAQPGTRALAGGTNLVDLMRRGVERPDGIVDITSLPLSDVAELPDGSIRIGTTVRNSTLAAHPLIRERYPLLSRALLSGASGQIRNMATVGGNLLQRTRCLYFMDVESGVGCNKREPGSGCGARGGFQRDAAIFGASDQCIAVHPSDMAVALAALDAVVEVQSTTGIRRVPIGDLHRLPGDMPQLDTTLDPGELIIAVELPPAISARSTYRKVRDRASFAFALVSVAAVLVIEDGQITAAQIALGGVASQPWRAREAERALIGAEPTRDGFRRAADAELAAAEGLPGNMFKIELARRTLVSVLAELAAEESER